MDKKIIAIVRSIAHDICLSEPMGQMSCGSDIMADFPKL